MSKAIGIWIITLLAVAAAFYLVPGVGFRGGDYSLALPGILGSDKLVPALIFAAILALVNSFIKPILKVITMPITIITLGIFALILNTLMLYLASWVANNFFATELYIASFWSALFAALIISIVTAILGALTGVNKGKKSNNNSSNS